MLTRGLGWRVRGLGQGDTPSVTSEIIDPADPRYIDIFPNVAAGGGISYTGTGANGAGSSSGSPGGTQPGSMQIGTNGTAGGTGTSSQPTTGIGPFAGSAGGSGFGPGLNLPNFCSAVFGQWLCRNGIWLLVGGGVALFLLLADSGRRR